MIPDFYLGFDDDQLVEYCIEVDDLFDRKLWGLDSVFSNLRVAQGFKEKWFENRYDVKMFEIAIPRDLLANFIEVVSPPEENAAQNGSYFASLAAQPSSSESGLGYEIVGVTAWSDMHTSVCYAVREDFIKDIDAKFNALGFFESFATARLAVDINNNQSDGGTVGEAEWFPVKMYACQTRNHETRLDTIVP